MEPAIMTELMSTLFDRVDLTYKTLNGIPFSAAVFVPKTLKSVQKTCPLLAHFHGGSLFMGTNPDPAFLSRWYLELAVAESAILVSPAYRLLPEASGSDILEDITDFWTWVHSALPARVAEIWPGLTLEVDRAAALGESAGGYLSLLSAFILPSGSIKAVMAQYCGMYPDIAAWNPKPVDGGPPDANAAIDDYLSHIEPGAVRLSSPFPPQAKLAKIAVAVGQTGRHREWLGADERLTLDYGLRKHALLPPIWIMQGTEDKIMPKEATDELVARIRKIRPDTPLVYSVQPGDHGFDSAHGLNEPYIAEGVAFVRKFWPLG